MKGFISSLVIISLLVFLACDNNGSSPTSPEPTNISGTWKGAINDSYGGNGTLQVTITQSGQNISGIWSATFSDPSKSNSGNLSGTFIGKQFVATLTPSSPYTCPFTATGTLSGSRITGTYKAFSCTMSITGTFSLGKVS